MSETINTIAEKWFAWEYSMLWQVGVLIIIIYVIDLLTRKWLWPQVRYALWLLILVKLILPPTLTSPTSFTSHIPILTENSVTLEFFEPPSATPIEVIPIAPIPEGATSEIDPVERTLPVEEVIPVRVSLSWKAVTFLIWLAGILVLSSWLIIRLRNLRYEHLNNGEQKKLPERDQDLLERAAKRLNLKTIPQVILSDKVGCPAVFGIFRPVLLIPSDKLKNLSKVDLEHIFLHELSHIKRGDLYLHAIYMILQIAYWFNPLLWLIRRQLQNLRELCCDATVARVLKEKTTQYRETLLETARQLLAEPVDPGLGLLGLFENSNRLFDRLKWLERKPWKHRGLRIITVLVLIGLMGACVMPMAKGDKGGNEVSLPLEDKLTLEDDDQTLRNLVIEKFRENKAKLTSGAITWHRITALDGFIPNLKINTQGLYHLWWDKEKIVISYQADKIHNRPNGTYTTRGSLGMKSYNGKEFREIPNIKIPRNRALPNKHFKYGENWFELIGWTGKRAQDEYISLWEDRENISLKWSLFDNNGNKEIKFLGTNEDDRGYAVHYYDISRGCNLVRLESYNPEGQLYATREIELEKVAGGAWFPILVDEKSFNPQTKKTTQHNRYVVDREKSSFNDLSAIPDGIFEIRIPTNSRKDAESALKKWFPHGSDYHKEFKVNSNLDISLLTDSKRTPSDLPDSLFQIEPGPDDILVNRADGSRIVLPSDVVMIQKVLGEWFENCSTGNLEGIKKAWPSDEGYNADRNLRDIKELLELNPDWKFSLLAVMWNETNAMAVSAAFDNADPKVGESMTLVWTLKKFDQDWKLTDIDLEELEGLQIENSRFMQKYKDANVWFDNPDLNSPKPMARVDKGLYQIPPEELVQAQRALTGLTMDASEKQEMAQNMIRILRQRIDPDNRMNLVFRVHDPNRMVWRAHGPNRIENGIRPLLHISKTTLKGHGYGVYSVAFSPDGSRLASGSADNTVRLWDGRARGSQP